MKRFSLFLHLSLCALTLAVATPTAASDKVYYGEHSYTNGYYKGEWLSSPTNWQAHLSSRKVTITPPQGMKLDETLLTSWGDWALYLDKLKDGTSGTARVKKNYGNDYVLTLTTNEVVSASGTSATTYCLVPCFSWLTYRLHYDATNNTPAVADKSYIYTNKFALASAPTGRPGYSFVGWGKTLDATKTFKAEQNVTGETLGATTNGLVTLYANWTQNVYTVTFKYHDANGNEVSTKETVLGTEAATAPADAVVSQWPDHEFTGWSDSSYANVISNMTINALYKTVPYYYITFNANGGEGTMSATNVVYDTPFALPESTFEKTGYTFAGWGTTSNATEFAAAGTVVSNLTDVAGATNTLYAGWTPNLYQIAYHRTNNASGTMTNDWATFDEPFNLTSNAYHLTGYSFAGWTNLTGAVYADGTDVPNLATNNNAVVDLWATWSPVSYTIHFDANGGTGTMDDITNCLYGVDITLSANKFTRAGRSFCGWNDGLYADGATVRNLTATDGAVVTLTASWQAADAELKTALDLPTSDESLVLTAENWFRTNDTEAVGGTCLCATASSTLTMETSTNGTLVVSFWLYNNGENTGPSFKIFQNGKQLITRGFTESSTSWESYEVAVTNAPSALSFELKNPYGYNLGVLLDHFVWTPDSGSPVPTEADAPVISALASSGSGLALTFAADSRFDYQLLGTNVLTSGDWPVLRDIEITNETMTVDGLLDETKPQMFYKVRVIQKQ